MEHQLGTPRQIAMKRMHTLGMSMSIDESSSAEQGVICGGLPVLLVSLLKDAFESWSLFFKTITDASSRPKNTTTPPPTQIIYNSTELKILQRTIRLLSKVTQLDPTLGEEIGRAGSQSLCTRLMEQINKCTTIIEEEDYFSEDDSDALVELQDAIFEIYSPSSSSRSMAFTNDELMSRLPLMYNLTSVSHGATATTTAQKNMADDNNCATIFISQVTKRQSAQADVGFVMWPSAIVLSRWLVSNPHVLQGKSILELGAGCGLVGITAAHIIAKKNDHESSMQQQVIITDVNEVVLENIAQNIHLNDVVSLASVAKLDFYTQTGTHKEGKWMAGETNGLPETQRPPVDVILAADIICQPEDAIASAKTIYDALKPGGVALVVCATAEHRFGVEIFASECEERGLEVVASNVAEMYDGGLLFGEQQMQTAAGYVDGMELTFFTINKR